MSKRAPALPFILATIFLDIMGIGLAIPVTPQLVAQISQSSVSDSATWVGVIAALYTGMMFLFAPLLGALSDRFGRKPVLLGSLFVSVLSYLGTALAPGLGWLLVARALGGLGGASFTVAQTYIADITPPEERARNFGLAGAMFGVAFIVGPAIGGLLGNFGLAAPFLAAAAVTALNLVYGVFGVPESHKLENRRPLDVAEANPLGWMVTLRRYPAVLALAGVMVWFFLGNQMLQSNWVVYTTHRFTWTPAQNGLSLAVVGLSAAIVQGVLVGKILPRLGEKRAIIYALVLNAGAMVAYGLAPQGWMMYAILVFGAIAGIGGPAVQGLVSRQVGPEHQGAVQGAMTSLMSLTGIVGPVIANGLFAFFTGPQAPFPLPGVAFFVGAACFGLAALTFGRLFASGKLSPPAPVERAGAPAHSPVG